jgi:hypothetical protein
VTVVVAADSQAPLGVTDGGIGGYCEPVGTTYVEDPIDDTGGYAVPDDEGKPVIEERVECPPVPTAGELEWDKELGVSMGVSMGGYVEEPPPGGIILVAELDTPGMGGP